MIAKISKRLVRKIAEEIELDQDKKEVIEYGLFTLIHLIISITLVVIFGAIFNVLIEALIISFTISILRKYSGGVHATSPEICTMVSTVICTIIPLGILRVKVNLNLVIILGVVIFSWAFYFVNKLAPVDSINKPIRKEEKRKRLKRSSINTLLTYGVIVIINLIIYSYYQDKKTLVYALCVYVGVVWQVFSLTKWGHVVLSKIDTYFYKFINRGI